MIPAGAGNGLELHGCLSYGLARKLKWRITVNEITEVTARAAAGIALLALTVLLENNADIQAHQWPDICCQCAV